MHKIILSFLLTTFIVSYSYADFYVIPVVKSCLNTGQNALSNKLHVLATRLHEIIKERCSVTPDTTIRLARFFGGDPHSWLNLQASYDLKKLEQQTSSIDNEILPLQFV